MADLISDTGAATRAADALLRGVGGRAVILRLPAPAGAGDAEQLGLAAPEFQDIELAPVVFRSAQGAQGKALHRELLVSTTAVAALAGSLGYGAAEAVFGAAFGVMVDGVLLSIESATADEADGSAYLYRLILRVPLTQAI
jgi:hypothetical protein